MFIKNDFFKKNNIANCLKRYKTGMICSFTVGLFIGSIPFIYKSKENFRVRKLIQEQRKIEIQNKEKICKDDNSDYKKFLTLGFPITAAEKLNICMKEL